MNFVLSQKNKSRVCALIGFNRSVVYYKRKQPPIEAIEHRVVEIFKQHNSNYGCLRIRAVLRSEDEVISKRRIGKILKKNGLESKHGRRKLAKNIQTATEERYIAENLIKGIKATKSDQICQMDVSQFKCLDGKLFASGIIDVYDKTITLRSGIKENKKLIAATIEEKLLLGKPLIIHSDRGPSNASLMIKQLLSANNIRQSMTTPYSPQENQYIESFWKTLKTEVGETKNFTRSQLGMILDYQVHYYNTERLHSSIGYVTPMQKRYFPQG